MTSKAALIIDDDPQNVSVLHTLLEIEGFSSYTVTGGTHWKTELNAIPEVAVIFLDLHLPRVTGYEVLSYVKSVPQFASIPIIAYTVHLNEMSATSELGFSGFLGKPINAELFPDQFARIMRGEKVWYQP